MKYILEAENESFYMASAHGLISIGYLLGKKTFALTNTIQALIPCTYVYCTRRDKQYGTITEGNYDV